MATKYILKALVTQLGEGPLTLQVLDSDTPFPFPFEVSVIDDGYLKLNREGGPQAGDFPPNRTFCHGGPNIEVGAVLVTAQDQYIQIQHNEGGGKYHNTPIYVERQILDGDE